MNRLMRLRSYETCFDIGLLASPLCGAAVTFFAAAKKVTKEAAMGQAVLGGNRIESF
ncbi:hypothetical protein [Caballeronia glathei]|uniref:hypothetical protein n=1 Tax=Caballeronia glathei TaxID=60547 RepID=UPI001378B27F|nr:hypothetical protein [Caballeronia glathei]